MEYRVEKKYLVSDWDLCRIRQRLQAVMQRDEHQQEDCYEIRSIYFDDVSDRCFLENEQGVDGRKKFRIRCYNGSDSMIRLEIKEKQQGLNRKTGCPLSREEYEQLLRGGEGLAFGERPALNQLLLQMRMNRMQPKTLVRYERSAFVHPSGNVRITFDRNIAAGRNFAGFFAGQAEGCLPVLPRGLQILEVKYDEFLPDVISRQLELGKLQQTTFSKYYLGRQAVNGELYRI